MVGQQNLNCIQRGALLVFEGCDRSGKSTQSKKLVSFLEQRSIPVKHLAFPARQSNIGQVINAYLTNKQDIPDECIHLLFTANRWEFKNEMERLLKAGTNLIVDRYSYSGVAYSVAKGFDYEWCMAGERGLIRPDCVFYMKSSINNLSSRGNFGDERYEELSFQEKVANVYNKICEKEGDYWHILDAAKSEMDLFSEITEKSLHVINDSQSKSLIAL